MIHNEYKHEKTTDTKIGKLERGYMKHS